MKKLAAKAALRAGLQVERSFTQKGTHAFDDVEWEIRTAEIKDLKTGKSSFSQKNLDFRNPGRSALPISSPASISEVTLGVPRASTASNSSSVGSLGHSQIGARKRNTSPPVKIPIRSIRN